MWLNTGARIFYPGMKRPLTAVPRSNHENNIHELSKYCSTMNVLIPRNYPLYDSYYQVVFVSAEDDDFIPPIVNTFTFHQSQSASSLDFHVPIINDTIQEDTEVFALSATIPSLRGHFSSDFFVVTIIDDDARKLLHCIQPRAYKRREGMQLGKHQNSNVGGRMFMNARPLECRQKCS